MKKLLTLIVILLVAVLMTQTVPDKKAHKEAMMEAIKAYVDEKADESGLGGAGLLSNIGKAVVNKGIELALETKLKVHNYYLLNTTTVHMDGKDQLLSVGLFGKVFTFDKEMLKERLENADKADSDGAE